MLSFGTCLLLYAVVPIRFQKDVFLYVRAWVLMWTQWYGGRIPLYRKGHTLWRTADITGMQVWIMPVLACYVITQKIGFNNQFNLCAQRIRYLFHFSEVVPETVVINGFEFLRKRNSCWNLRTKITKAPSFLARSASYQVAYRY